MNTQNQITELNANNMTVVPGRKLLLNGSAKVLSDRVRYSLYCIAQHDRVLYQLCAIYGEETAECFLLCEREAAVEAFFAVLRGKVTPCSLVFIVKDMIEEGERKVLLNI